MILPWSKRILSRPKKTGAKVRPQAKPAVPRLLTHWHISQEGIAFNRAGLVEFGLELYLPGTDLATEEDFVLLVDAIRQMVRNEAPLDQRTRLMLEATRSQATIPEHTVKAVEEAPPDSPARALVGYRLDYMRRRVEEGRLRGWRVFLFQTLVPPRGRSSDAYTPEEYHAAIAAALKLRGTYHEYLKRMGIDATPLDFEGAFATAFRYLNPDHGRTLPDPATGNLREQLGRSKIGNRHPDRIKVGETWVTGVTSPVVPAQVELGLPAHLIPEESDAYVVVDLVRVPPTRTANRLELEYQRTKDLNETLGTPGNVPKIKDLSEAITRVSGQGEQAVRTNLLVVLRHHDRDKLLKERNAVKSNLALKSGGQASAPANFLDYWTKAAPFGGESHPNRLLMLDGDTAYLFPVQSPPMGSSRPIYLLETSRHTIAGIHPFERDTTNNNALIIGRSGAGKTYLAQSVLGTAALTGARIAIIDKGKSYLPLVETLGGNVVFLEPGNKKHVINPFQLPPGQTKPSEEKKGRLRLLLRSMLPEHEDPATVDSLLLAAIETTYARANTQRYDQEQNKTVYSFVTPTLSDFVKVLRELNTTADGATLNQPTIELAQKLAMQLSSWTGNTPYGALVDGQTTVDASATVNYFDVSALSSYEELLRVAVLLIAELLDQQVFRDHGVPKIVVFDEVWALLKHETSRELIEDLFRRVRKFGGAVWAVTQSLAELSDEGIQGILPNVSHYYFLAMSGEDVARAHQELKYPAEVAERHARLRTVPGQYAELLYLKRGPVGLAGGFYRVPNVPEEYWLYSNNPNDIETRRLYRRAYGDLHAAIAAILRDGVTPTEPLPQGRRDALQALIQQKEAQHATASD